MPEFKKDKSGFRMKGFSPFNMGNAYKTPMKKPLVGNQDRLPEELKEKILDSPMTMYDKSAMKKYGESPMKRKGDPPVKPAKKKTPRLERKESKKKKDNDLNVHIKYDVPKGDMKKMDKEFYSFKPKQYLKDDKKTQEPSKPSTDYFNPEYWGNYDEID